MRGIYNKHALFMQWSVKKFSHENRRMKPLLWSRLCVLGLVLVPLASLAQEDVVQQHQAYVEASSTLLATYMKEQNAWNHYFTTIAPDQGASDQLKPQETYRRFLLDTLTQWRQLKTVSACQTTHLLYETALYSYGVAADFRLIFLHAKSALLSPKQAATLAEERARHYTAMGDDYFKRAALLAQATACVAPAAPR
jgi:hypothetical protein